jgi:hypothetical protein
MTHNLNGDRATLKDLSVGQKFFFTGNEAERGYKSEGYREFPRTIIEPTMGAGIIEYAFDYDPKIKYFFGEGSRWHNKQVTIWSNGWLEQFTLTTLIQNLMTIRPGIIVAGVSEQLNSYRGYYEDLAIAPGTGVEVSRLIEILQHAKGESFCGYKGGMYKAGLGTRLWICERGTTENSIPINLWVARTDTEIEIINGWDPEPIREFYDPLGDEEDFMSPK